jgi:DNA polymerase-1
LIDGDIVAFRAAASCEKKNPVTGQMETMEPRGIALARTRETMEQLFETNRSDDQATYISGESNFRFALYPQYKANRPAWRPKWLEDCKEMLITEYGGIVTLGYEADDGIGIEATRLGPANITICSIDKDLKQLPGRHHNWVRNEYTDVDDVQGLYNFYWHCLVGDSSDNVKGCPKIGEVRATNLLARGSTPRDWFDLVRNAFANDDAFLLTGKLIWVLREEGKIWEFPYDDDDNKSSSEVSS